MNMVKLPNNRWIASNIFEIVAFPKYDLIDADRKRAFEMNSKTFERMVFELHKISDGNSAAIELLWFSE